MNWIFTPSFCPPEMMLAFLVYMEDIIPNNFTHVIIDDNYPIDRVRTSKQIKSMAKSFGSVYLNPGKNLGLHKCLNWAINELGVKQTDFYVNCDADDRPTYGTFQVMKSVMESTRDLAVLGCYFDKIKDKLDSLPSYDIAGYQVIIHPSVEMWNVSAINLDFLFGINGFDEPYAFYGGLESYFYSKYSGSKWKIGYLKNYRSDAEPFDFGLMDKEFIEYKREHTNGPGSFKGSFEEFLKDRYPHKL